MTALTNYLAGVAAEKSVAKTYLDKGFRFAAARWRGKGGEIDLIFRDGDAVVFVEVKKSKSHARAAEMIKPKQMQRIFDTATEFVANEPKGQLTDMRFDVALVDANGAVEVLENALMPA